MKAVLVIDMPEKCAECKLCKWGGTFEGIRMNICSWTGKMGKQEKLDGCPLRPLPKKLEPNTDDEPCLIEGWNACIDEITGETE